MIRARLATLALSLTAVAAPAAWSQTQITPPVSVVITADHAPGDPAGVIYTSGPPGFTINYQMGPFSGTVDGGAVLRLNCVDFFHDLNSFGPSGGTQVNLGDAIADPTLLVHTRLGTQVPPLTTGDILKLYQEAAWLTTMTSNIPSSDALRTSAVQSAIWSLLSNSPVPYNSLVGVPGVEAPFLGAIGDHSVNTQHTQYWIDQATTTGLSQTSAFYKEFNILTPVDMTENAQELMYQVTSVTPEPASLALMGTGLLGLGGMAVKRRRNRRDASTPAE